MATCDTIQPLIDILGCNMLLLDRIDPDDKGFVIGDCTRTSAKRISKPGLYYSGAHWYAVHGLGKVGDSYSAGYQLDGTAHFCQTFAAMIFTGADSCLVKNDYAGNIQKAMDFWIEYVDTILSGSGKHKLGWLNKLVKEMAGSTESAATFKLALLDARGSAASLKSCK